MFNTPMPPPVISSLKRKSLGDLPDHVSKRQAVGSPGEMSPRALPLSSGVLPAPGAQAVNILPRPNGYAPAPLAPSPSVSATPYNPAPPGRRRGRPPKTVQNTWQVSTYPPTAPVSIAPSPAPTITPQPHSPGFRGHPYQAAHQGPLDPKPKKKVLPEIAPRPAQGVPSLEPAVRSPAIPGAEYQTWREETSRRPEYYQLQGAETMGRESHGPGHTPILPRPRSPHRHPPSSQPRPILPEPTQPRGTPPATLPDTAKRESHTTTAAAN